MNKRLHLTINNYRTYVDYYHRRTVLNNRPRIFAIELTNYCNLDCSMCPRQMMKREIGFMDFDLFKAIVDQCKKDTDHVWLHLFGESTFHPRLKQCIDYCAEQGIKPYLSTNATILTEENAHMLLTSGLELVYLCLDGSSKETYDKLRLKSDFTKTRGHITDFLELKKKLNRKKPITVVSMIRMEETQKEIDAFRKQWKGLADQVLIKKFCSWANQNQEIVEKMEKGERDKRRFSKRKRYPCTSFWKHAVVHWNGDVVPCCLDFDGKMILGNLKEQKLEDIWNSARVRAIREAQKTGNFDNPLCQNCAEWVGYARNVLYPFSLLKKNQ